MGRKPSIKLDGIPHEKHKQKLSRTETGERHRELTFHKMRGECRVGEGLVPFAGLKALDDIGRVSVMPVNDKG